MNTEEIETQSMSTATSNWQNHTNHPFRAGSGVSRPQSGAVCGIGWLVDVDCEAKPLAEKAGRRRGAALQVPRVREVFQPKCKYSGADILLISSVNVVARRI